jgi:protein gp37
MGDSTKIAWCDHTFNAWIGCFKRNPDCKNCYAEEDTFSRVQRSKGLELWGPPSRSHRHVTRPDNWRSLIRYDKAAAKSGVRTRVFCQSLSDTFENNPVLEEPRRWLLHLVDRTPHIDKLLLTKRPENVVPMTKYLWPAEIPSHVWIGASAGHQKALDDFLPHLRRIPTAVRFLSLEPLTEALDVRPALLPFCAACGAHGFRNETRCATCRGALLPGVDWVIVGGESGDDGVARPCALSWIEDIVLACVEVGVPCFVKQLGSHAVVQDGSQSRRLRTMHQKGGDPDEWPASLRVRQFPLVTRRAA